ncbi:Hydrogen cyanide synthase subunit HcnC [subsurface metagenome]
MQALAANARRLGAEIYTDTEVTGIDVKNEKVEGVFTDKGKIRTHVVINAAGAWSADVARMAGVKIPTMPYHEEAIITEPLEPLPYYPLCSSTIWGRQTKSGQIISGEDYLQIQEPGYRTETTLDFLARITRVLQSMIPRLRNVNILRQWGGVEDITPDELPIVGEVDELEGLILACGCQGFGFCFSQAMGKLITDLIVKHEKCEAMEKLSLRRFKKEYREYPGRWYGSRPN